MHGTQRRNARGDPLAAPPICSIFFAALFLSATAPPARALVHSHVEEFTTTTYKDKANTTADWDTTGGGRLQLFLFPVLLGTYDTPGNARAVAISGTVAYVADGASGLMILNVTNPASPTLLGSYNTPGSAWSVAVSGTRAYVADGATGLVILNVTNPASPTLLGSYNTPGDARAVALSGTVAYVADGASGLEILNVSSPASPTLLGSYDTPGNAWSVVISGTRAYVADGATGLVILNVSNLASPALLGSYNTPGDARAVAISGTVAYVADGVSGLEILNVSSPSSPTLLGSYDTPGAAEDVAILGSLAYVTDGAPGVHVLNVSNPTSPGLIATYDTPGTAYGVAISGTTVYVGDDLAGLQILQATSSIIPVLSGSYDTPGSAEDVAISGTTAYVADGPSGLQILDVTNPAMPTLLGSYDTPGSALGVAVSGTTAYVADGPSGLQILDVTNPASPALLGTYETPGYARAVAISGTVAYVADNNSGLQILDVTNPAMPAPLGSYDTPGLAYGVAVSGTVAYVADGPWGLQILNVANPASPTLLDSYATAGWAYFVAVSGTVAYVADGVLEILDVMNPASPRLLGKYSAPDFVYGVAVSGTVANVACGGAGLKIVDVSTPTSPVLLGGYDTPDLARAVAISGTVVYVADRASGLQDIEVIQSRFDIAHNLGRSLTINNTSDEIRRGRVTSTQVDTVAWELTANGGAGWQAAAPGSWVVLSPGSDLRWRAALAPVPPFVTAANPGASRVQVDWLYDFASINSIRDVPGDQGGWLRLRFARSTYDFPDVVTQPVSGYQIYHRIDDPSLAARVQAEAARPASAESGDTPLAPLGPAALRRLDGRQFVVGTAETAGTFPPGTWEAVAWIAATQSDEYVALVPTTADSTASGVVWSVYLVTAHTTTPSIWYAGYADSGYSMDNLAPNVPTGFVATYQGGGNHLAWDDPVDADFRYFRIYRSTDPGFAPGPTNLVHSTTAINWSDTAPGSGTVYYKLSAVDFSGNESGYASANVTVDVDGAPLPSRFGFYAPAPNPFRRTSVMRYDVPAPGGRVRLAIYDLAGRLVRSLVDGVETPGEKRAIWDARDDEGRALPSGMYLCSLHAAGFARTHKVLVIR